MVRFSNTGAAMTARSAAAATAAATTIVALAATTTFACPIHLSDLSSANDVTTTTGANLLTTSSIYPAASALSVSSGAGDVRLVTAGQVSDPSITAWRQNVNGQTGSSPNATLNAIVSSIPADVKSVAFNDSGVYVRVSGVPSHAVGPFPGNPAAPSDVNRLFRIPRNPQVQNGTKTATGLGAIGMMVNGVPFFNAADARSYNNQNIWHQNANVVEAPTFDAGRGHPAPIQGATGNPVPGAYHYHQSPTALINQVDPGNTGQAHSKIIGYALDGFPIYGPYGYANADGTGGVERMDSSYQLRSLTQRTTLADGTALQPAQYGPAVGAQYPLGYYLEDYGFVSGAGDLDQYNGRFTVTPEYPQGTYAYFASVDSTGAAAFPYLVGPRYYGVVATDNLGNGNVVLPADVSYYTVPEPAGLAVAVAGLFGVLTMRRRRRA